MSAGLIPNRTLLAKADLQISDLLTDGGHLEPEDAKNFIRLMIRRAVLMAMVIVDPMKSPKKQLSKLRFADEVLKPGVSGQALASGDRSKPNLSEVELDAKLFKAEVRLNNEVLEDSIEQGNLKNTVMQEFAKAVSRDAEKVAIRGDTASASPLLAVLDGFIKQATSNVVVAGGVTLAQDIFRDMLKTMPIEFQQDERGLKYLTSSNAERDYRDAVANRADAAGVRALGADAQSAAKMAYTGIDVEKIPLFPEDLGGGGDETVVLLTDPSENMVIGFHREMSMETDKDVTSGELIMVMSLRMDAKYKEETAVVKATGVTVS